MASRSERLVGFHANIHYCICCDDFGQVAVVLTVPLDRYIMREQRFQANLMDLSSSFSSDENIYSALQLKPRSFEDACRHDYLLFRRDGLDY